MNAHHSIVVVGGGISGLATAWWLHRSNIDVVVLEANRIVGGTMQTIHDQGWLVETGPNSALETTPLFQTLFSDLEIIDQVQYANEQAKKRYILRDGKLYPIPMSPGAFIRSPLWSATGKSRLLKELFIGRASKEETVAEFVTRRLGEEFLDYAIDPFVAGVFAGDPAKLSVQAAFPKLYALEQKYGGLIKGQILGSRERKKRAHKAKDRSKMFSFGNGMQTLPESIARALGERVKTGVRVEKILPRSAKNGNSSVHEILATQGSNQIKIEADATILAVPAYVAAGLLETFDRALASSLKSIYYPPVVEVFLGFAQQDIDRPLDGFGFLVPAKEKRRILGAIWSSSIFPNRAPDDAIALTTFIGGSRQPELTGKNDDELLSMVTTELRDLMQVKGTPIYSKLTRWEKAIPQYQLGHLAITEQIEKFENNHSGIFLTGNYRGGISVGDCVVSSKGTVERAREFIEDLKPKLRYGPRERSTQDRGYQFSTPD